MKKYEISIKYTTTIQDNKIMWDWEAWVKDYFSNNLIKQIKSGFVYPTKARAETAAKDLVSQFVDAHAQQNTDEYIIDRY